MTDHPKLGALAIVVRGAQVLLVQRSKHPDAGLWGFPGGHVELGETALEAAARELLEETSVIAQPRAYLDNVDVIERDADGQVRFHYLLAGVICDYISGTPAAGDDALDAAWVSFEDIDAGRIACSRNVGRVAQAARAAQTKGP